MQEAQTYDKFEYKGRSFPATRALRANKDECRTKFNKILLEGDYTSEQLVEALKYDVQSKKDNSVSTGTNKLIKDGAKIVMSIEDVLEELQ